MFFCSRSLYMTPETANSYQSANGTWSGVIGLLVRGHTDIGLSLFAMTAERRPVVNYISNAFNAK